MAGKENSAEEIQAIQVNPADGVSNNDQPSARSMVETLVADQSVIATLSQAILAVIKPSLPEHNSGQTTNNENVAAPVGQSTNSLTGVSLDQTVQRNNKRKFSDTVDLTQSQSDEYIPPNDPYVDVEQSELDGTFASATSSRWEASEELDALLNIILKPLPRFDRRAIIRELPRPVSDAAWTPSLDSYLPSMISGVKTSDTALRETQDKVLDILGPLCTLYENINLMHESCTEDNITLDKASVSAMFNCVKKAILLVGDTSAQLSAKRREQVLTKLNPYLTSLGKEDFPEAGKELFGEGFESRLKLRTETANTVAQAKKAGRQFFPGSAPRRFQGRFRGGRGQTRPSFFHSMRGNHFPFNNFRGRGRAHTFSSPRQFHSKQ